jgi:hypothetical protein
MDDHPIHPNSEVRGIVIGAGVGLAIWILTGLGCLLFYFFA